MMTLVALVASASLVLAPALPQTPQTPPVKGTGRIAGRISDAMSGKPIASASLRLIRWEGGRGMQSAGTADADGHFEFKDLLPGSYQLTVSAERYIGLEFGQRTATEPGRRIELAGGQQFDKADFNLMRTSAIEGRLTDEFGDPVPGVSVQLARVQFVAGKRRLMPLSGSPNSGSRPTDDLGRYRVFNVPPGDYYVLALSGPFAGADDPSGFAPTFYPGTRVGTDAKPVHVDAAQDVTSVSFPLTPAPMGTLSGNVVDTAGQPVARADVILLQTNGGDVRTIVMARQPADADGVFSFRNVAPGSYVIQAFGRPEGGGNLGRAPFGSLALEAPEGGSQGLRVAVGGATLRGHIVFEGPAPPPAPGAVMVSPMPLEFVSTPIVGGPPQSVTHDDWTFEVNNMSGRRAIRMNIGSPVWTIKRVMFDGKDITDDVVDFTGGDVNGVEITLTSTAAAVTGSVTDDSGGPASGYGVIVFPEDRAKWTFPSRYIAAGTINQQGVYRVSGLPPGQYRAIALPASIISDAQDPEFLATVVPLATGVLLSEGETKTVPLKLVKR